MAGVITSLPPLVEQPPGNNSSNPAGLPGVTYVAAIPTLPQTWTGLQTFNNGSMQFAGSTSGATLLNATAIASGTLTLPAATDTLVARNTSDVLTNKSIDGLTNTITNVPTGALDPDLQAIAALTGTGILVRSVTNTWVQRSVVDGASITVTNGDGVSGNISVAVTDPELVALAGLVSAADKLPYFTGSGTASLADFTAFGRSLVDDANAAAARTTLGSTAVGDAVFIAANAAAARTAIGAVIGTDVQAYDADLAALAANSTAGLWTYTGAGTGAARTLTAPAAGMTITNPAGTAGNPTFVFANDLGALEGLSSTGIARRTGTDAWSVGTLVTNAELATVATATFKGRTTAGTGSPEDLTATQATALLNVATTSAKGLVPVLSNVATQYLDGTGAFSTPAGGGGGSALSQTSGKLTYVSTTAIKFAPYFGDQIRISGSLYSIPAAGIAGIANTSVFVNGTGSSNLGANTTYYVYAFNNSGTVTADFRTDGNGHLPSDTAGNVGTEVRVSTGTTKDDSRTLIGMVRTNASSQFVDSLAQRFVRTWYNDGGVETFNSLTASRSTTSTSFTEINSEIQNQALLWAGERWVADFIGPASNSSGANATYSSLAFNSTTANEAAGVYATIGAGLTVPHCAHSVKTGLSEGFNYVTLVGKVSGGTGAWDGSNNGGVATLSAFTRR